MTDQPQTPQDDGDAQQPGYGTPAPGYGTPDPAYGTPPAGFGTPPAGYGAPGAPGFPTAPKTNGLAIGALVASVIGLLCGIGSIIGIVLGFVALSQINQRGEGGRGLAIAGIVIGAIGIVATILIQIAIRS